MSGAVEALMFLLR